MHSTLNIHIHFHLHVSCTNMTMAVFNNMLVFRAVKHFRIVHVKPPTDIGLSRINRSGYYSSEHVSNEQQPRHLITGSRTQHPIVQERWDKLNPMYKCKHMYKCDCLHYMYMYSCIHIYTSIDIHVHVHLHVHGVCACLVVEDTIYPTILQYGGK